MGRGDVHGFYNVKNNHIFRRSEDSEEKHEYNYSFCKGAFKNVRLYSNRPETEIMAQ